ncbi:MAG TPA: hypothetical protein VJK49_04465 [Candidatus Limnocylindrales bacterium]|nr:hypothetical protein [Candidatus Limnocylindrales bacterium]
MAPSPTPGPPLGSIAEAEPYCALIDPDAIASVLGYPFADSRVGRSRSGGAECIFASGDIDTDPGENVIVSFDRTANLARWTPGQSWDAQAEYESRVGRRWEAIADLGMAAAWDRQHFMEVQVAPDVVVEILFGQASAFDALVELARGIATELALSLPPATGAPIACRLLTADDVEAALGAEIAHVWESPEFNPATTCAFSSQLPGDPFASDVARVVLFRTEDIRPWLASDKPIGFVADDIIAQAATYTAQRWLMDLGLYGTSVLIGEGLGPKGPPIDVDGACAAYWYPGDAQTLEEARFEAAFGADDYLVVLALTDDLGIARQLAAAALTRLTAERGGSLSSCG